MSSSSGAPTTGRPPQIGRNSIYAPGFNDFDFRVSRDIPIHESIYMQFSAEAFNLLNHQIITSVNTTYSQFINAGATTGGVPCKANTAPAGSALQGCISPFCHLASQLVRCDFGHKQRALRSTPDAVHREAVLLINETQVKEWPGSLRAISFVPMM